MTNRVNCPKCKTSLLPTTMAFAIGKADCPVCQSTFSVASARAAELRARGRMAVGAPIALDAGGASGDDFDIQWMPPGEQSPVAHVAGEPRQLNFTVKPEHAEQFNEMLQQMRSDAAAGNGDMPFIDFNHEDAGASGRPTQFYWGGDDPKKGGIRLKGKWTKRGKDSTSGAAPEFTRFSPEWFFDEDEQPVAIGPNLGGLVNRAAFKSIASVQGKGAEINATAADFVREVEAEHCRTDADFKLASFQVAKRLPNAARAYRTELEILDKHPFQIKAQAVAIERGISIGDAQAMLAARDFPLYQDYMAAVAKHTQKVTVAKGNAHGQQRFLRLVKAKQADGLPFEEAVNHVCYQRPETYEEYRRSFR